MRIGLLCPLLLMAACPAKEWKVAIQDEGGRGLAGAQLEAVLTPPDDPRLSSVITRTGQTDADGGFRFMAEDRMVLTRVKAKRAAKRTARRARMGSVAMVPGLLSIRPWRRSSLATVL